MFLKVWCFYVAFAIGCSFRCACMSKSKDHPTCSHGRRNVVTRKCKPFYSRGRVISRKKSAYYTPKPRIFLKSGISKPWVSKKGPVTSRFHVFLYGQNAICFLHPQTPGISSNKDYQNHGSPKRTCNKQISILVVLRQKGICLLHPQTPGIS